MAICIIELLTATIVGSIQYFLPYYLHCIVSRMLPFTKRAPLSSRRLTLSASNMVYILLFAALELCLLIDRTSYLILANGLQSTYPHMQQAAGAFGFIAGLLGYYACARYMCEEALPFRFPMGHFKKHGKTRTQ